MPKILRFPDPPKPAMTWNYNKIIWFAIVILAGLLQFGHAKACGARSMEQLIRGRINGKLAGTTSSPS
jgi:hypothetical protein